MANKQVGRQVLKGVEADYRAGLLSIRCIAAKHHVSEAAVRKWAKSAVDADGHPSPWQRDLNPQVIERVKHILSADPAKSAAHVRAGVRTPHARATVVTQTRSEAQEEEISDLAARTVVEVVRQQRVRLHGARNLIEQAVELLGIAAESRDLLEQFIMEETAGDLTPRRRRSMLNSVSLGAHAAAIRDLATAMQQVVTLERQAYGLKPGDNPIASSVSQPISQEEIDRKLEELRRRFEERLRPA